MIGCGLDINKFVFLIFLDFTLYVFVLNLHFLLKSAPLLLFPSSENRVVPSFVVYFNQQKGAAWAKGLSKATFLVFAHQKKKKKRLQKGGK